MLFLFLGSLNVGFDNFFCRYSVVTPRLELTNEESDIYLRNTYFASTIEMSVRSVSWSQIRPPSVGDISVTGDLLSSPEFESL